MRHPEKYIAILRQKSKKLDFPRTPAVSKVVPVDRDTEISETIMMGLRMVTEGIHRKTFQERFNVDVVDLHSESIKKHQQYGLLEITDEVVRLTSAGRLLSNAVIRDLI
jgi:oxygen-independent coproporphyrinogen-3 oxidase